MITLSVVLSKIIVIRAAASSAFSFASDNSCSRCSSASAMVLNASATRAISDLSRISTRREYSPSRHWFAASTNWPSGRWMNRRAPNDVRTNTSEVLRTIRRMPRRVRSWISAKACALSRPKLTTSPPELGLQGRVAFDPLHAIDVEDIDGTPVVHVQVFITGHLYADEPVVIRVAREIRAVAIRDGERSSRWNTLSRDVISEPIQAETRYNDAAHPTIVAIERQRKLNDLRPVDRPAEYSPTVNCSGLQDAGKVGPRSDIDRSMVAVGVAERSALHVGDEKGDERRKSLLAMQPGKRCMLGCPSPLLPGAPTARSGPDEFLGRSAAALLRRAWPG